MLINAENRKRHLTKRRFQALGLIFLILLAFITSIIIKQLFTLSEFQREFMELHAVYEELVEEEKKLKSEITLLNDMDYIAEIARRDYKMTKPGEILFLYPGSSK